ncbi:hypothetical protein G6L00_16625 [Agrobacterium rhizogenes]|nr:hypothetical protein [Rhizobium rhizogenes]
MQQGNPSITPDDIHALSDFVKFVGEDCFDQWQNNGTRAKSMPLLAKLRRMYALLDALGVEDDEEQVQLCWLPPSDMAADKAVPALRSEISGRDGVSFQQAQLYQVPPDLYFGDLQFAIDEAAGQVCAIVAVNRERDRIFIGPEWLDIDGDVSSTIGKFVDSIAMDRLFACG